MVYVFECNEIHYKEFYMNASVYKVIEVIGASENSWEEAAKNAVSAASGSLKDIRVAEVSGMDIKIEEGNIIYRTRLKLSFKYLV